jgi:hypothetical protein
MTQERPADSFWRVGHSSGRSRPVDSPLVRHRPPSERRFFIAFALAGFGANAKVAPGTMLPRMGPNSCTPSQAL